MIPKADSPRPLYREWANDAKTELRSINFGVKAGNSVGYVEMFGMAQETIYTMSADNEKIEVKWDTRFDEEVVANVARYKKHFIKLEDDAHEYITDYDAAEYLAEVLPGIEGRVKITGTVEKQPYKTETGEEIWMDKYLIRNITVPKPDEKCRLELIMDLYYNDDFVDASDEAAEQTITVDGYVQQYISANKANERYLADTGKSFYIPQRVTLSGKKLDMENPDHKKLWQLQTLDLKNLGTDKLKHMQWVCRLQNGPEEVEFDESQLTDRQKLEIELGVSTIDDFKPTNGIFGKSNKKIALIKPLSTGIFKDGIIEADDDLERFNAAKAKFKSTTSLDEAVEGTSESAPVMADDDLFDA